MKIVVHVKTNASRENIEKISSNEFKISVCKSPIENQANKRVVELISDFFDIPKTSISIISGTKSKIKILEF